MNEIKKLMQSYKIINSRYLLIIIFSFYAALIHADSSPPLSLKDYHQEKVQEKKNSSFFEKIENFVISIFVLNKKTEPKISQELNENLADLVSKDEDKKNKSVADNSEKSFDEGSSKASNDHIILDSNEPVTIPALPDDKPTENTLLTTNQLQSKAELLVDQKNQSSEINDNKNSRDVIVVNNKIDDKTLNTVNVNKDSDKTADQSMIITLNDKLATSKKTEVQILDPLLQELNKIKKSESTVPIDSLALEKNIKKELPVSPNATLKSKIDQANNINQEQSKFIIDESKVLLLPEDDVVLGQVSIDAKLENMDDNAYIDYFNANFVTDQESLEHYRLTEFIHNYERKFHDTLSVKDTFNRATIAVNDGDLEGLKALIDNYPILQEKDKFGQNLLHLSVKFGQYYIAEFLIMRGININARDNFQNSPISLSKKFGYNNITLLLKKADAK